MMDLLGTTLGQYQIVELIGEGGMASVYKAWQPNLRRYVALKVLAPRLADNAAFIQRFQQEAVSVANLRHTHVVTIHDVGAEGDHHYIAMEYVEGVSLEDRIREQGAMSPQQALDVLAGVGAALDYAHGQGFIHRDVKPANILIAPDGRAVLTDFGIVKALSGSGVTAALTQNGSIFGTPHYMSPEQVREENVDHRADLYALGIVSYEMLSGQVPFDGATTHSILYAQANTPPPPLRQVAGPAVSPPLEAVVHKMLAKQPRDRYDSAGAFARDLSQAIAGVWPPGVSRTAATPDASGTGTTVMPGRAGSSRGRGVARPRRRAWVFGALALGAVLVLAVVAAVLLLGRQDPLKAGQAALAAGDYALAAERFEQVLAGDPAHAEALEGQLAAASASAAAGEWATAGAAYEAVYAAQPGTVRASRGLGEAYAAQGEWETAVTWYERWTQTAPEDAAAWVALGRARFNVPDYAGVVAAYERAVALGAGAGLDAPLGIAYFELTAYDKAVERLARAVAQEPEDFAARRALGLSLYAQGKLEAAAGHLQAALALGTNPPDAALAGVHYGLGGVYFAKQDYESTIEHYERARELDPQGREVWAGEAQANLEQAYVARALAHVVLDVDFSDVVRADDAAFVQAETGQRIKIEGAVQLVDGPEEGTRALLVEEGTVNLVKNPLLLNPKVGYDFSQWNGSFIDGGENLRGLGRTLRYNTVVTKTRAQVFWDGPLPTQSSGATYAVQYWARSNTEKSIELYVQHKSSPYDNASSIISRTVSTDWTFVSAELVLNKDVDDKYAVKLVRDTDWTHSVDWIEIAEVQVEEKDHITSFCYGDAGQGYNWGEGEPHASISVRHPTRVNLDEHVDLINAKDDLSVHVTVRMPYDANHVWPYEYGSVFEVYDSPTRKIHFYYSPASRQFKVDLGDSRADLLVSDAQSFKADDWLDIILAIDSEKDVIDLYVNGQLVGTGIADLEMADYSIWQLGTGAIDGNWGNFAFARLDIVERALGAAEAAALYRIGWLEKD